MSDESWLLDPSLAVTVIEFEIIVDEMIQSDGRTPDEVQAAVTDAIEAAASEAATSVGATVTEVKWNISRRPRT